jgi:hypothetical protein
MVRRPRSHEIEDLSRDRVRHAFSSMGWTVEDLRKDYGEDLLVRIFEAGVATPLMFFTQCKGTDSVENYTSDGKTEILFPVKRRHIEHWDRFWEPVILSVWDSKTDRTYWECIQSYLSSHWGSVALAKANETKADILRIPVGNILDEHGLTRIKSIIRIRFERFELEKTGAHVLVKLLEEQLNLKIDYNPQAGMLITEAPGESPTFRVFGKAAEELEDLRRRLGCSPEDTLEKVVTMVYAWRDNLPADGKDLADELFKLLLERRQRGEDPADVLDLLKKSTR